MSKYRLIPTIVCMITVMLSGCESTTTSSTVSTVVPEIDSNITSFSDTTSVTDTSLPIPEGEFFVTDVAVSENLTAPVMFRIVSILRGDSALPDVEKYMQNDPYFNLHNAAYNQDVEHFVIKYEAYWPEGTADHFTGKLPFPIIDIRGADGESLDVKTMGRSYTVTGTNITTPTPKATHTTNAIVEGTHYFVVPIETNAFTIRIGGDIPLLFNSEGEIIS